MSSADSLLPPVVESVPADIRRTVGAYRQSSTRIAVWQLVSTLILFAMAFSAALTLLAVSWALAVPCVILSALLVVRLFVLQHDAMHGSLFPQHRANVITGYALSLITVTPHHRWRAVHFLHHASAGNLDRRSTDLEIYTMTADEYRAASPWKRLGYRIYRYPLVLFGLMPFFVFNLAHRFTMPGLRPIERFSVHFTNLGCLLVLALAHFTVGLPRFLLVYVPMSVIGSAVGVWLFYIQHHFRRSQWRPASTWSFVDAAIESTSVYDLPQVLAWFSANIGFHHVHHLDPRVPNYRLKECHEGVPVLQRAPRFTLSQSLNESPVDLWDQTRGQMIRITELDTKGE